jgi:uncharacterized membrane protein YeaQ/YmgE (transglycosylase-associated protein family)
MLIVDGLIGWISSMIMRTTAQQSVVLNIGIVVGGIVGAIIGAIVGALLAGLLLFRKSKRLSAPAAEAL